MKEILLNSAKALSGAFQDQTYEKLEIPIELNQKAKQEVKNASFIDIKTQPLLNNSSIQLQFNYNYGMTQVIVAMYGPSEAKQGSKQDPSRSYIEISLKDTTSTEDQLRNSDDIKNELKNNLEQIILLSAYPKTVISFQLFVVKDQTNGVQTFSACMNGLIAAVNIASLKLNASPVTAMTFGLNNLQMIDTDDNLNEIVENPDAFDANISYLDLVVQNHSNILFMRQVGKAFDLDTILGSQKLIQSLEKMIKKKSKSILKQLIQ